MARKARALWISLYHLGAVHNRSEQALEAFAKRQLKCERLAWANQRDAFRLIEALKDMAVRGGWLQHCRVPERPRASDAAELQGNDAGMGWLNQILAWAGLIELRLIDAAKECK